MKNLLVLLAMLFASLGYAQEEVVHSVYFEFDKFNITTQQEKSLVEFITKMDTTQIESISIFGYTDDRGKDDYNYKLSNNRAGTIKDALVNYGIKNKIIVAIEGKGKILIDDDIVDNLPEVRSKNRRVDVVANMKEIIMEEPLKIPGIYEDVTKDNIVGDRIYLKKLLFERGSSKLTPEAKRELDKIVKKLQKYRNIHFEIQGHVCCTPKHYKEAIDRHTKRRELSKNRAQAVYDYLITKKIHRSRMSYKGYGTSQPMGLDPRYDRRVEFLITKVN